ncbi:redox-sensing transcriptional repressor Rex [Paludicola sp. MB14-C6]|uniref:redox-sensing transcriptional repressor Rex n=1 Tax=Paludihabitans sp. MB14-C6 TaxID=3070656 RepID=UPI0027DE29CA|nr:redox-sensing transcriptional repressor Rex [Paludicola sp. MB14-C6]WMJ23654.1 redox-sensing transcriptional repressor Rex [Paludicola sp. MB14-C6]
MSETKAISIAVIRRLPRYYRFLGELLKVGTIRISSRELSDRMGLTASQIRQDLNCFGGFGQQGYGYNIQELHDEIGHILGLDKKTEAILVGGGNLGRAVANHMDFDMRGFKLVGIFDHNEELIGQQIKGIKVCHTDLLEEFCNLHHPQVAILCIPKTATRLICDRLIPLGIKGFWNFSHYDLLDKHSDIVVENVHLSDSLMTLSYKMKEKFHE